jgi:hypothetical protein
MKTNRTRSGGSVSLDVSKVPLRAQLRVITACNAVLNGCLIKMGRLLSKAKLPADSLARITCSPPAKC